MGSKAKLFAFLWLAGMAGVGSLLLIDFAGLIANLPLSPGTEVPPFTPAVKVLTVAQPAVIMSLAILAGVGLASKVGLRAPMAEALASSQPVGAAFVPQVIPGLLGGVAGGIAIVLTGLVGKSFLPADVIARIGKLGQTLPFATRLLYGGIVEELLLRWGLMTLLAWAAWRLFQKGQGQPKPAFFAGAILLSSLIFAVGHLPLAFVLVPEVTPVYVAFVLVANSAFGLIAGFLYWKKGLESAVIAHMVTHALLLVASLLGVYF